MLDLFASVGVQRFDLTFTDLDGEKRGFRRSQSLEAARRSMCSSLIQTCAARGTNIIVRPIPCPPALLVQLDDLNSNQLARVAPAAFLTISTSPGNHQAWIAVKGWSGTGFALRLKKAAGADPSATEATRVAGTTNFKWKYKPDFPTVAILRSAGGRVVSPTDLAALGLVNPADLVDTPRVRPVAPPVLMNKPRAWPRYARSLAGAPIGGGGRPDSSKADFNWCMCAADWGHSVAEIAAELLRVSDKARARGDNYATKTAEKAAAMVRAR